MTPGGGYLRGSIDTPIEAVADMAQRICSLEDCDNAHFGKGLCSKHYTRLRRWGTTDPKPPGTCSVVDCSRELTAGSGRGWCPKHYQRWRAHGDPEATVRRRRVGVEPCSIDGCEKPIHARTWCSMHLTRWERYGDPLARVRGEVVDGCRICPSCLDDKPLSEWAIGQSYCRDCATDRIHRSRLANMSLTIADYNRMLADQGGVCAICGDICTDGRRLAVDHDHSCCPAGRSCGACVRGLLCRRCNLGIAQFDDDPRRLRAAIAYLT